MSHRINPNNISTCASTEETSQVLDLLKNYLADHLKTGYLIFQVFQASPMQEPSPVANATITLYKSLGEEFFISRIYTTDSDRKTEPIALPTVSATLSQSPDNDKLYSTYDAVVEAVGFLPSNVVDIPIFEGITTIQPVKLLLDFQPINLPKTEPEQKTQSL